MFVGLNLLRHSLGDFIPIFYRFLPFDGGDSGDGVYFSGGFSIFSGATTLIKMYL